MISQRFDKEHNILFVTNEGRVNFESMKIYFSSLKNYVSETQTLFILEDARKAKVKFSSIDLPKLSNELSKVASFYTHVYHAVIFEEQRNIAYAMMLNDGILKQNYVLKVFSDESLARDWVSQI